jgi:hypothetical protein
MLLVAAMVGCGIGLSAATWVRERFVPALVHYGTGEKTLILGLLAKHARRSDNSMSLHEMCSVGRHLPGDIYVMYAKTAKA